jgi:cell fate (sporulation/competence/biofilm development) regulator YmcA (YheA/YmcA/DUF963 family)
VERTVVDPRVHIIEKAEYLADQIAASEEYALFKQAEEKLNRHAEAQALLFVIRAKRNKASQTGLKLGDDHPLAIQARKEYEECLERLTQIPVVEQYQSMQAELNDLIQGITKIITATLNDMGIPVSRDAGDLEKKGCGSGGKCGCRH